MLQLFLHRQTTPLHVMVAGHDARKLRSSTATVMQPHQRRRLQVAAAAATLEGEFKANALTLHTVANSDTLCVCGKHCSFSTLAPRLPYPLQRRPPLLPAASLCARTFAMWPSLHTSTTVRHPAGWHGFAAAAAAATAGYWTQACDRNHLLGPKCRHPALPPHQACQKYGL